MIRIWVDIQNQRVNAIIDTGAQVTILNDQIFDQLPSKPYTDRETQLHTAGREMNMKCRAMQPMCFSILGFEFNLTTELCGITVRVGIVTRFTEGLVSVPKVTFMVFPFKVRVNFSNRG
jgi:hypothetical protein